MFLTKRNNILFTIALILFSLNIFGEDASEDKISKQLINNIIAAKNLVHNVSYEFESDFLDYNGKHSKYLFKYSANGVKWKAERFSKENNKYHQQYIHCYDGMKYQLLDFSTGQLQISSQIIPNSPIYPRSFYDNAPLQLLGFLNFSDIYVLPSSMKAASLEDAFSIEKWNALIEKATIVTTNSYNIYTINDSYANANKATQTKILYSNNLGIFPDSVEKKRVDGNLKSMEAEVLDFNKNSPGKFNIPSKIRLKWYSPINGNKLVSQADITLNSFEINNDIKDDSFTVDINLANEVWDVDNRVIIPIVKK